MEAGTNSSTGGVEPLPEGAPSAGPTGAEVTPTPHPARLEAATAATPPPEEAVPTPLPTMASGEIGHTPAMASLAVTPAPVAVPAPSVVIAAPAPVADPAFSDQIINWMSQGDRLGDSKPVEDLDLSDLAEPTDPVAHELLDSRKRSLSPVARSRRVGRWISVGALGVAMSFGLYWAAQEPGPGAVGYTAAAPAPVTPPGTALTVDPTVAPRAAPAAAPVAAAPQLAAAEATAANARGHHKHHRGAGRIHRHHTR